MKMSEGMYFSLIAVMGDNKPTAEVALDKGLNVISGASETGKTYILQCMNFILGSKDRPKDIPLSRGYQKVQAEIKFFNGKTITACRYFNDNLVFMAECPFEEFGKHEHIQLSTRHSQKTDNISAYLLSELDINGIKLKETKWNGTNPLSFRDFANFLLVTEQRIISEKSPVFDGLPQTETENKALFKFLLTGSDDKDLPQFESPEFGRSRIKGKIELIQKDIQRKEEEISVLKKRSQALTNEEINVQIAKLISVIEGTYKELQQQEQKREAVWSEITRLKTILIHNEELKKRFNLLSLAYSSDLKRLEFINEGKFGIQQVKEVNCPLCNSLIEKKLLEPYEEKDEDFVESIQTEYSKINKKQTELDSAIIDISEKIEPLKQSLDAKMVEFQTVDKFISDKLKPIHQVNSEKLQNYLLLRDEKAKASLIEDQIKDLHELSESYDRMLSERLEPAPEIKIAINYYEEFCRNVKELIVSWGLPCERVIFDPNTNDIEIDGVQRWVPGKGYKAIYFSAFMIGLLQHCIKNRLPHPRFLVLDSPLVSYKENDPNTHIEAKDRVSESVQDRFYESIANLDYLQRVQVIIIENRRPSVEVSRRINEIHFTQNKDLVKFGERYGFFPV